MELTEEQWGELAEDLKKTYWAQVALSNEILEEILEEASRESLRGTHNMPMPTERHTDPGSSRGTNASHPLVWEGTYDEGDHNDNTRDNSPLAVRVIEIDPNDLLVQIQYELDGMWDTATTDDVVMYALHAALVDYRKAAK